MSLHEKLAPRPFEILREIGIDAAHRIPHHTSKCRNLHGHRYRIQAVCRGALHEDGEQRSMVLDFGFLKDEMMSEIDAPCDHGTILWSGDPVLVDLGRSGHLGAPLESIQARAAEAGYLLTEWFGGKLYIIPTIPTAENLAAHWHGRLAPRIAARSDGMARLHQIRVWETPTCQAVFPSGDD